MTTLALILALLGLALSGAAAFLAVAARADSRAVGSALARHRQSHAERTEERRTVRHHPPAPGEPATEELTAVQRGTAAGARPPLPRPGQIGRPVDREEQP